jgi:hypothetical protein
VCRFLAVENDVQDRVQTAVAGERAPQVPLGNGDRVRRLAPAVENAGDQPLATQSAGVRRASALTLNDLECDALACHGA